MLTKLYLLNKKNEMLDLLCSPFHLKTNSLEQIYKLEYETSNTQQFIHSIQKKELTNHTFKLEGFAKNVNDLKNVDDYILRYGESFRLFMADELGIEYYCHVIVTEYKVNRLYNTDMFTHELSLNKISNWQREIYFESRGELPTLSDEKYPFTYDNTMRYIPEPLSNSFNPSNQIDVRGDEPAPFCLILPSGGSYITWTAYSDVGSIIGRGRVIGTFDGEVIIDTRPETQGIYVNGIDRRGDRDISAQYEHFFNLPVGKCTINVSGVGVNSWYGYYVQQDRLVSSNEY